jgi:hypothetical protein
MPLPIVHSRGRVLVDSTGAEISPATSTIQTANGVLIGAVNETAPASDTANSGLNGRLQRIAQRLSSIIALIPTALGLGGGFKVEAAGGDYEHVAASQTDQMMGGAGAVGDRLDAVLIIPTSVSPGAVSIEDGSANTVIFDGGANSVLTLHPFLVPMGTHGISSVTGGWEITTGANVRAIGYGQFSA